MADTFKINRRQEKFCQLYCKYLNATQAYNEAYAPKGGLLVAGTQGSRLLQNVYIQNRIEELRAFTAGKFNIAREEIIKLVATMAKADRRELYDENGDLKPIHELTYEQALVIDGLEQEDIRIGNENIGRLKKLKIANRNDAIKTLNTMLGYNSPEKIDQQVNGNLSGLLEIKIVPSEKQENKEL